MERGLIAPLHRRLPLGADVGNARPTAAGYRLVSHVMLGNAFGATAQTRFSCTVDRGFGDRYHIVDP